MAKPIEKKAKKQKLGVCMWDEEALVWNLKNMPAQVVPKLIEKGNAVYPVDGQCPVDAPIDDDEEEME
jgi:hypothetical protein